MSATYERFMETRYWPALDGVRAVSILLVLAAHTADNIWSFLNGSLGVTLFFVISGFLITTLLVREETRKGAVSLRSFYVRRVFRIAPLYFLALGLATLLVLGFGLGAGKSGFLDRLPLLLTFNGELAGSGTFSHSWSLGIEEKFYILWPLLAFAVPWVRKRRLGALSVLVIAALLANFVPAVGYAGIYFPILGGCGLALVANSSRWYFIYSFLSRRSVSTATFIILIASLLADGYLSGAEISDYSHVVFASASILALPGLISGSTLVTKILGTRGFAYFGTLAYAIYLFHPFVLEVIDRLLEPGQGALMALVRLLSLVLGSFLVALALHWMVELPFIRLGKSLLSSGISKAESS